jgi:LysM repeat protein
MRARFDTSPASPVPSAPRLTSRGRRHAWLGVVVVLGVAFAAAPADAAPVATRLTIEREMGAIALTLSRATLRCGSAPAATGYLRRQARSACALVHRGAVQQVATNQRTGRACEPGYGGPQYAHIVGTIGRRSVDVVMTRTNGCGAADWQTLAPLLGDPLGGGALNARPEPVTTTLGPVTYTVQRGDTLTKIAHHFGVSIADILFANRVSNPDALTVGQRLVIPPVPPSKLVTTPPEADAGTPFVLKLTGAKTGENIIFDVNTPDHTYTGPKHPASADGAVTATYRESSTDATGIYIVVARGDQGTTAQTTFRVDPIQPVGAPPQSA